MGATAPSLCHCSLSSLTTAAGVVLLSSTTQSIDLSPTWCRTVLVLPVRRLLVPRCRANAPEYRSGTRALRRLRLRPHRGPYEGFSRRGLGVGIRETSRGRWGTAGGWDVCHYGLVRDSRVGLEPSLTGEPEGGTNDSPVNRGRGALCSSDAEKSIGSAPTSIVAVSVQFALIATSISPLDKFVGEKRRVERGSMYDRDMAPGRHTFECEWSRMRFCCGGYASWPVKHDNARSQGGNGCPVALDELRQGTISERRLVVLCESCGLEISAHTLESLSFACTVKNEEFPFAVRPEKHIIVQERQRGGDANPFMTPMLIQAHPTIRNTRHVNITPLRRKLW
ncbi:hypothetical protein DFH94DRAFT_755432 [Russula ochroleuca]|jgi:hypothetical protein|uniref:Uncharacterized protein n=1 Tax=Russula ochroleuca TaxID=152965 RepID=A0A9P5MSH5_9AGAM|nr:hypothetical protein DFH94DRAFT_755432 [Russula ochroleuca]